MGVLRTDLGVLCKDMGVLRTAFGVPRTANEPLGVRRTAQARRKVLCDCAAFPRATTTHREHCLCQTGDRPMEGPTWVLWQVEARGHVVEEEVEDEGEDEEVQRGKGWCRGIGLIAST